MTQREQGPHLALNLLRPTAEACRYVAFSSARCRESWKDLSGASFSDDPMAYLADTSVVTRRAESY